MAISQKLAALFYEIRADTASLPGDLQAAERHLGKITEFVNKHPVAAMGALATATIGVGVAATKMALDVERSLERVARKVPGATGQMSVLRDQIRTMSLDQARDQKTLAEAAKQVADGGVQSLAEVQQRLDAATRAADATGAELGSVISGLDQTLDLFTKGSEESEAVMQRLFAVSQGRMPLTDLFDALQGAAPTIKNLRLDFDTAAAALGGLIEQGKTAKQASSELKALGERGAEGRKEIERLADAFGRGRDASNEYNAAVIQARNSTDALWQITKNNLAAVMIDLGQSILPLVTKELQGIVGILDVLNGKVDAIKADSFIATLTTPAARAKMALDEVRQSVAAIADAWKRGNLSMAGLSGGQLQQLRPLISDEAGRQGPKAAAIYRELLVEVDRLIMRDKERAKTTAAANAEAATGAGMTAAQIKELQEAEAGFAKMRDEWNKEYLEGKAAELAALGETQEGQKAYADLLVSTTRTLVDDLGLQYDRLIDQFRGTPLGDAFALKKESVMLLQATMERIAAAQAKISDNAMTASQAWNTLNAEISAAELVLKSGKLDDADRARLEETIRDLKKQILDLQNGIVKANKDGIPPQERTAAALREQLRTIAETADHALQLLAAFGAIDDKTADVLRNIVQIGSGIARIASGDVIGGTLQTIAGLADMIKNVGDQVFGHPARDRARAFREELRQAREEWELMLAPLADDVSGRSPLQQELVGLERQAEALRRQAARDFLPHGERDPRAGMSIDQLTAAAAAARRRGHHAGAEGIEAYRDALIQIEELFEAKEQQAGRRDAERQRDVAGGAADPGTGRTTTGLAGLSYVHGDTLLSLTRQILSVETDELRTMQAVLAQIGGRPITLSAPIVPATWGSVPGGGAGSITVGTLTVNVNVTLGPGTDPAAAQAAAYRGVDEGLQALRMNLRAAAGAPRTA